MRIDRRYRPAADQQVRALIAVFEAPKTCVSADTLRNELADPVDHPARTAVPTREDQVHRSEEEGLSRKRGGLDMSNSPSLMLSESFAERSA